MEQKPHTAQQAADTAQQAADSAQPVAADSAQPGDWWAGVKAVSTTRNATATTSHQAAAAAAPVFRRRSPRNVHKQPTVLLQPPANAALKLCAESCTVPWQSILARLPALSLAHVVATSCTLRDVILQPSFVPHKKHLHLETAVERQSFVAILAASGQISEWWASSEVFPSDLLGLWRLVRALNSLQPARATPSQLLCLAAALQPYAQLELIVGRVYSSCPAALTPIMVDSMYRLCRRLPQAAATALLAAVDKAEWSSGVCPAPLVRRAAAQLTNEQMAVAVAARDRLVADSTRGEWLTVNAYAGTGKTAVCLRTLSRCWITH